MCQSATWGVLHSTLCSKLKCTLLKLIEISGSLANVTMHLQSRFFRVLYWYIRHGMRHPSLYEHACMRMHAVQKKVAATYVSEHLTRKGEERSFPTVVQGL